MKVRFSLGLALLLMLSSHSAWADDSNGRYAIKGVGGQTCASFTEKLQAKAPEVYMYLGWFQGWMSNENRHSENTFDLASWQHTATLFAALENYCKNNPKHPFVGAAEGLIHAMRPGQLNDESRLLTVEAKGRKVAVYQTTLLRLQQALKKEGLYQGKADSKFGPGTEKAILAFQKREKLPESGLPDQIILQRLVHKTR